MSVDVGQSVVLQIEVISMSHTLYRLKNESGVRLVALFSHVDANTGRIHIHVALAGKRWREGEEEGRDIFLFLLFFSISP